jgi:hypothetical protein
MFSEGSARFKRGNEYWNKFYAVIYQPSHLITKNEIDYELRSVADAHARTAAKWQVSKARNALFPSRGGRIWQRRDATGAPGQGPE